MEISQFKSMKKLQRALIAKQFDKHIDNCKRCEILVEGCPVGFALHQSLMLGKNIIECQTP